MNRKTAIHHGEQEEYEVKLVICKREEWTLFMILEGYSLGMKKGLMTL